MRKTGIEDLEGRMMFSGSSILSDPALAAEASSQTVQAELGALPTDEALAQGIATDESRLAALRTELSAAQSNPVLPIDNPQWGTNGAPAGAIGKLRFDEGRGNALATNPQGTMFLMALASNQIQCLDAVTGEVKFTLGGHGGFITGGAWSPDGSMIATSCNDKIARVFDAVSGKLIASAPLDGKMMTFSHDGKTMAFAKDEGAISLVDAKTLQIKGSCAAEYPDKVAFTQDDSKVWYTDDMTIKVKDLSTQTVRTISPGMGSIWAMGVSEDGRYVGIGGPQGTVAVLDATSGKILTRFSKDEGAVITITFVSGKMVVGYQSGYAPMLDLSGVETGKAPTVSKEYRVGGMVHMVAASKSGRTVLVQVTYGPKGLDIVALPVPQSVTTDVAGPGTSAAGRAVDAIMADISAIQQDENVLVTEQGQRSQLEQLLMSKEAEEAAAALAAEQVALEANQTLKATEASMVVDAAPESGGAATSEETVSTPEVVMETPELRFDLTFPVLTATATGLERDLTIDLIFENPNHTKGVLATMTIDHISGQGSVTIPTNSYPESLELKGRARDAEKGQIDLGTVVAYFPNSQGVWNGHTELMTKAPIELNELTYEKPVPVLRAAAMAIRSISREDLALSAELTGLSQPTLQRMFPDPELSKRGEARLSAVPGSNGEMQILVNSPFDESYLMTPGGTVKLVHPGGAKDLVVFSGYLDQYVHFQTESSPQLDYVLYEDEAETVMLDRIELVGNSYDGRFHSITAMRNEGDVDYAFEPSLQVLKTDKANVTVALATPFKTGIVEIEGGGALAWREIRSESGTAFDTMTLTMDRTKPSGTYQLLFLDRLNGTILKTVNLVWSRDNQTLTTVDVIAEFVPQARVTAKDGDDPAALFSAASQQENEQIVMAEAATGEFVSVNPVARNAMLDNPLGEEMIKGQWDALSAMAASADSQFKFTLTDEELSRQFLKACPQWQEDNRVQTMKEMHLSADNFYYYRGTEFDSYRKCLEYFNSSVGRLIEQGIRAVEAARAGGDPEPYFAEIQKIYDDPVPRPAIEKLKQIGPKLPGTTQVLSAAAAILEHKAQELIQTELACQLALDNAAAKVDSSSYAGSGEASAPDRPMSAARQQFFANLYAEQAKLPMYAADGKTIIGYGGVLGTTVVDATRGITDIPITGVDTQTYGTNPDQLTETPNSKNTMIIVIYGSGQFPEQEIDEEVAGFDSLTTTLRNDYSEVWPITPGENPIAGARSVIPGMHIEVGTQQSEIENLIKSRVEANPDLHFVLLVGYSWGGGDVYVISNWLTNESGLDLKIAGTVYVDAIVPRSHAPENRMPPGTSAMLNLYQSRYTFPYPDLNGAAIPPDDGVEYVLQLDLDQQKDSVSHTTIDEASKSYILNFIRAKVSPLTKSE